MYPVLGASLLSAAASLPLHLMPFLVVSLVAEGRLPVNQAGWIASAYMGGQLASAIALPLLGVGRLRVAPAAVAVALVAAGPWLSYQGSVLALLSAWFLIGIGCGSLQFLGATTAAAARRKTAAFAMRLCAILFASALAIVVLGGHAGFGGYGPLAWQMGLALALLGVSGLAFYRSPAVGPALPGALQPHAPPWLALTAVFLVFAGQPGFWAYAVQGAQARDIDVGDVALAIATAKVLSALLLVAALRRPAAAPAGLLTPGLAVGAGILLMAQAKTLATFVAGVLVWEAAVNLLSVRFQAAVIDRAGAACGSWLAATIFLGAAVGPLLHGLAIQAQAQAMFIVFACFTGLVPFAWYLQRSESWPARRV